MLFYLAAMHFNECPTTEDSQGETMYRLAKQFIKDPLPYWDVVQRIPVPQDLCAQLDRPSMEDAVAEHVSRFSRKGV
ncbi:hypothetical protein AALO_G00226040 [Alosa alosa]|uniref:Uncharacterized protein n=1 Tax=Alosa alosa TaxID=278164 RepID=A0AAV6G1J6_9TELE|nr:hypothetical protein AALO_G00226040 [Alosa alosa]